MTHTSEIVEAVRKALETRDYKGFAACFLEDGVYERPFALNGGIKEYKGVRAIFEYIESGMAAANKLFEINSLKVEVHPCREENVVFAEFFLSGKPYSTAEPFKIASSAALITCQGNKISRYRDFPNSAGIAQAAGTIRQHADSLLKFIAR